VNWSRVVLKIESTDVGLARLLAAGIDAKYLRHTGLYYNDNDIWMAWPVFKVMNCDIPKLHKIKIPIRILEK